MLHGPAQGEATSVLGAIYAQPKNKFFEDSVASLSEDNSKTKESIQKEYEDRKKKAAAKAEAEAREKAEQEAEEHARLESKKHLAERMKAFECH